MVTAYDTARTFLKDRATEKTASDKSAKGKKGASKKATDKKKTTPKSIDIGSTNKKDSIKPDSTLTPGKIVNMYKNNVDDTKAKMEEKGTSMEDLMAEKQRKEKEKAATQEKK